VDDSCEHGEEAWDYVISWVFFTSWSVTYFTKRTLLDRVACLLV